MNNNLFYKMSANLLQTESINKVLHSDSALSQFGLIMLMWFTIQDTREKKISKSVLLNMFRDISSTRQRTKALESGFFAIDEMTEIVSIDENASHACEQTLGQTLEQTLGQTPEQTAGQTQVPYSQELDKEIDKEKIVLKETSDADDEISYIKKVLLDDNETLWRQTLLMQCPFGDQLKNFWNEAVGFFISHAITQVKLEKLYNESEVRRYFTYLVMGSNRATQRLRKYLSELEAASQTPSKADTQNPFCFEDPVAPDGSRSYGGRPIPNDAPPRPSDKAEWNDAIENWI